MFNSDPGARLELETKFTRRRGRFQAWYTFLWVVVAVVLCVVGSSCFHMLRAATVFHFRGGKPRPMRVYDHFFGYARDIKDVSIAGTLGPVQLRVYTPRHESRLIPILLVHGFAPNGNRDGYLNSVADQLAEMGYMVVLPNVPAETRFEMRPSDMTVIDDAIHWSANATGQKVSVFGISFGGGLAIAAALQPVVKGDVKLIFSLSGYNDLDTIGRFFLHDRVTGPDGAPYPGHPSGPLLIVAPYLGELVPAADLPALRNELDQLKKSQGRTLTNDDPSAHSLTASQQLELDELEMVSTPRMHRLYCNTLSRHHNEIAAISPSSVLFSLNLPLYVLHGANDPVFPEGEIEWMKKEVAGNPNAHIVVTPWITHALVGQPATRWQKLRVVYFGAQLLNAASHPQPLERPSSGTQAQSTPAVDAVR